MGLASSPRFRQVSTYEGTELVKGAQGQDSSLTRRFIYVVSRENRIDGPDLLQNAQEDYIREFGFLIEVSRFCRWFSSVLGKSAKI